MMYGFRAAREGAGLSMAEVAKSIGTSKQALSNWETGRKPPSLKRILQLSDLYAVSLDVLVKGKENT